MNEAYLTLAVVAAAALLAGFTSKKLRLPSVIGLILVGILIGPYGLGLVKDTQLVSLFAEIGGILLLFLIGTEFSLSKIGKLGLNAIIVAVIELGIVFMVAYEASILLGFSPFAALFIGITLSVTSTALTVKIIQEMGLGTREEVPLLVGVSVIEDVFAVFILAFISGLATGQNIGAIDILFSSLKAFLVFSLSFFVLKKTLTILLEKEVVTSPETINLVGFSLVMGLSFISLLLGLSAAVGAFIAGSIVSSLPRGKEVEESTKHFSLLFTSLFFLSIGMLADPKLIVENFNLILIFVLLAMTGKFIGVSLGSFFAGYPGHSSVFSGLAMIPIGEISLLIAKVGVDAAVLPAGFLGVMAMLVLTTSLLSYPMLLNHNAIYSILNRIMPRRMKNIGFTLSKLFLFFKNQLEPEGALFGVIMKYSRNIFFNLTIISLFAIPVIFLRSYLTSDLYSVLLMGLLVVALYPSYLIFRYLQKIFSNYSLISSRTFYREEPFYKRRVSKRFSYAFILLLFAFFGSPLVANILGIRFLSLPLSIVSVTLAIILLLNLGERLNHLKERFKSKYKYRHRRWLK